MDSYGRHDLPLAYNLAWYSPYGYLILAIFLEIALYAFRTSLGGRPLLAAARLDD